MNENEEQRDEMMNCGLSIQERDLLQRQLQRLPDTMPPRAVWQRIEEQARAEQLFAPRITERTRWFAGAGLAAAVVLAVLNVPLGPVSDGLGVDGLRVDSNGQEGITVPAYADVSANNDDLRGLNALMVESRQIERNLRALPAEPSLVRASTAATISELQDQIAAIDYLLNHPEFGLRREQKEIYWQERVRLMNSLLQLRTAQSQRMTL